MNRIVPPGPVSGTVERVISSKSQAHRLLIAAGLAGEETRLEGVRFSRDVRDTCACLCALGAEIRPEGDLLRVIPIDRSAVRDREAMTLDCGESGSTLRFLLPVAAALGAKADFTGRGRLAQRPLSPLYEEMERHGVQLSPQGRFPLRCRGQLRPGRYTLDGGVSSQFLTGLLLALPLLEGDSKLTVTGRLESRPYVRMTLDALRTFGVKIRETDTGYEIPGGQRYRSPATVSVEGDWSGAAFWLAAGALGGRGISCGGLNPASSQGDRAILPLLRAFGARIEETEGWIRVTPGPLKGICIEAEDIPDLVPPLAVVAACAAGDTRLEHIARLRLKESDRVETVLALLRALGVPGEATEDTMIIHGRGGLTGGTVDAAGDHRIVMAAAVAAIRARGPVEILGAEAVDKSYPGFFEELEQLREGSHDL